MRKQQLRAPHRPNKIDIAAVVEIAHESLQEASATHRAPAPKIRPCKGKPPAILIHQFAVVGRPQSPGFPTLESLKLGQPDNVLVAKISCDKNMALEQLRDALRHTWSS